MPINNIDLFKKAIENENNAYVSSSSSQKIHDEKTKCLKMLELTEEELNYYHEKLRDYRHVDDLNSITHGSYIRWIDLKDPEKLNLSRGGILCDVKIGKKGILLLCKSHPSSFFFNINMDECLVFQRLTQQEKIILVAMDYLEKS